MTTRLPLMECRHCTAKWFPVVRWAPGNGVSHMGAYCANCGLWLKWMPQTDDVVAQAPPWDDIPSEVTL